MSATSCLFRFCFCLFSLCLLSPWTAFGQPQEQSDTDDSRPLITRHPYIVNVRGFGASVCSGVLIGEYTVVTAAQCVDPREGREDRPTLWLNATRADEISDMVVVRETVETAFHPNYTGTAQDGYNLAMLRLNASASPLAPLRVLPEDTEIPLVGRTFFVLSFGRTSVVGPRTSVLQIGEVEVLDPQQCIDANIGYIEDQMFCVDSFVPCSGDSGGPVFIGRTTDTESLYGLVSGTMCFENIELSGMTNLATVEAISWLRSTRPTWESEALEAAGIDPDLDEMDIEPDIIDFALAPSAEGPDIEDYYEVLDMLNK